MSGGGEKPSLMDQVRDWRTAAFSNPLFLRAITGAAVIALLDQASKIWIVDIVRLPQRGKIELSGIFDLTYVENRGASFGMLAGGLGSRILLSVVSISVAVGFAIWLGRVTRPVAAMAGAFVIGGALGNLVDRVAYGFVVDFLDFSGLMFPWVFNVADMAVNVGVALFLLDAWQTRDEASTS